MRPGRTTPYALLGMLRLAPQSGYSLRRELASAAGLFWNESYGQIYPGLRELTRRGWAKRSADRGRTRRAARGAPGRVRYRYEITPRGERALQGWLAVPPRRTAPRDELLLKLFLGDRDTVDAPSAWVRRLLLDETDRLRHVRRMMATLPRAVHGRRSLRHWLMALEFVERQAEASVAWCQRTLGTLDLMQEASARRRTAAQRRSPME